MEKRPPMNLRYAIASALVGWYLMVPPTTPMTNGNSYYGHFYDKNGNEVKLTPAQVASLHGAILVRPDLLLAYWTQAGAFDTASECESQRLKTIKLKTRV
jgi:hypothetical protein